MERDRPVRQAVDSFYAAFHADDFTNAAQFATEDWTHINPSGGVTRGRDANISELNQVHSTFLKGVRIIPDEVTVTFATEEVAVATVVGRLSAYTTPDGERHENERPVWTFVLVMRNGRWLILLDQNTVRRR